MSETTAVETLLHLVFAIIFKDWLTVGFIVCTAATVKTCIVITTIIVSLLSFDYFIALLCFHLTLFLLANLVRWCLMIYLLIWICRCFFCLYAFEPHTEHAILVACKLCAIVTIIYSFVSYLQN